MKQVKRLLQAIAGARAQVEDEQSDALYAFYERLIRLLAAHRATIELPPLEPRAEGPALAWEALGLRSEPLYDWIMEVAALFATQDPGMSDEAEAIVPEEALTLARLWYEQGESGLGPAVDSLLANALAPYLEEAAARLEPALDLKSWSEPYCPLCHGFPNFALWDDRRARQRLICERCATEWQRAMDGCLFCGETEPEQRGFYSSEDELYRVEVCDSCGLYIKGMDRKAARQAGLRPLPAAERILTPGLDLLALQEGYGRPAGVARPEEEG